MVTTTMVGCGLTQLPASTVAEELPMMASRATFCSSSFGQEHGGRRRGSAARAGVQGGAWGSISILELRTIHLNYQCAEVRDSALLKDVEIIAKKTHLCIS